VTGDGDLSWLREDYRSGGLDEADLAVDPYEQFGRWFDDAVTAAVPEPNAMVLATAGSDGRPSARTVLLKGVDQRGFSFFTNYDSQKARALAANPACALVLLWKPLARQVCVAGRAERLGDEESSAYFSSRPRGSRLGAWASPQSQVLPDRATLERRLEEVERTYGEEDDIPRPPHWGGFLVVPDSIEFWQGRTNRLHDRLRYRRDVTGAWVVERLAP